MDYNGMLKNGLQWNVKKWITMISSVPCEIDHVCLCTVLYVLKVL